jgi:hypothetical protein
MTTSGETSDFPTLATPETALPQRRAVVVRLLDRVISGAARTRATVVVVAGRAWRRPNRDENRPIPEMSESDRHAALQHLETEERCLKSESRESTASPSDRAARLGSPQGH